MYPLPPPADAWGPATAEERAAIERALELDPIEDP
jgi:hypothetical protein